MKTCSKCKEDKDIAEYVKKCGMCIVCRRTHRKEYRKRNIETFKENDKKHYEKYREKKRSQQNQYYVENQKRIQMQRKQYRENNIERYKLQQKTRYDNNISLRLGIVYRNRVRSSLGSGKGYDELLGCSFDFLKCWFEFNFELDNNIYTWSNYGKFWEIDHVIPCCNFDMEETHDIHKCFNWKNTKPLSVSKNRSKNRFIWKYLLLEQELRIYIFSRLILENI